MSHDQMAGPSVSANEPPANEPPANGPPANEPAGRDALPSAYPPPGFTLPGGLRNVSLVTKMVAAVLALVLAALVLISVASTIALRSFLLTRMDDELESTAMLWATRFNLDNVRPDELVSAQFKGPTEYMLRLSTVQGVGTTIYDTGKRTAADLPPVIKGLDAINARIQDQPYTSVSPNGRVHWRMMVVRLSNGSILHVGRSMDEIEFALARLVWIDALVGGAVLIALAGIGAAVVRKSLIPLVQIERTAGAIAAGDLSRRVPDPEPGNDTAYTELGRLSRALNAMLAQIETAFTARAESESAARAAESAARDAAEAAQRSESRAVGSEEKMRQFVADASHELRTPLTTIRGFAELYRQGAVTDPEAVARLVRRIEDEAARMGLLVEDLLLLARLDRERPIAFAPVELPVLGMDAVQAARATAPERTIELEVRDPAEQLVAYGDDARLRQVIGNLMTNALVHTPPEASVTLRLRAEPGAGPGQPGTVVMEVSDTGPGLSPEQRERVFERFYRADEARTRRTDRKATSTGLGLAIVAAIVRAHHGAVEVLSEPGQGATFRVRLPHAPPD